MILAFPRRTASQDHPYSLTYLIGPDPGWSPSFPHKRRPHRNSSGARRHGPRHLDLVSLWTPVARLCICFFVSFKSSPRVFSDTVLQASNLPLLIPETGERSRQPLTDRTDFFFLRTEISPRLFGCRSARSSCVCMDCLVCVSGAWSGGLAWRINLVSGRLHLGSCGSRDPLAVHRRSADRRPWHQRQTKNHPCRQRHLRQRIFVSLDAMKRNTMSTCKKKDDALVTHHIYFSMSPVFITVPVY